MLLTSADMLKCVAKLIFTPSFTHKKYSLVLGIYFYEETP